MILSAITTASESAASSSGLTHEEIGEMIGVTRETITRLLNEFKNRQVLAIKGATVTLRNRAGLESGLVPIFETTS
jgi:CRP-like cAMP-binding protein